MTGYASYVICTSPRSGSTLLCNLLSATKVAGKPDSHFHAPSIAAWLGYYDLVQDQDVSEREVLRTIFDAAVLEGSAGTGIFGLRLQRQSFDFLSQQLAVLQPGLPNDAQRMQAAFGRTLFVHLTREDKLAQAVSYVKAQQSGLWHMAPDGTELERLSPPKDLTYDAAEIAKQMEEFSAFDQDWNDWFASEGIEPIRISYAAMSEKPAAAVKRILTALGLDTTKADGIAPGVRKLADETSGEWIRRFRGSHT